MTGKVVFCKVNQFTRADEVANAIDGYRQELGSEVKVKGHKLPGGEIALYWSTKRSTLWERLTGKAAERRRLARIAFKQVQKNEHWALEKDVCFIHEHHKEAFSTLLSSVGFIKAGKGHRLMEKWNGKAMRSKSLFVQLRTLDRCAGPCEGSMRIDMNWRSTGATDFQRFRRAATECLKSRTCLTKNNWAKVAMAPSISIRATAAGNLLRRS